MPTLNYYKENDFIMVHVIHINKLNILKVKNTHLLTYNIKALVTLVIRVRDCITRTECPNKQPERQRNDNKNH